MGNDKINEEVHKFFLNNILNKNFDTYNSTFKSFKALKIYKTEVFDWIINQDEKYWRDPNSFYAPWEYRIHIHDHLYTVLAMKF